MKIKNINQVVELFITLILLTIIIALPTMWLWNWLMPIIFNLPEISFLQSLGMLLLSGILFKGTAAVIKK